MHEDEQQLLERARAGDRAAFSRLAAAHREAIYGAAYFVLEDPEDALDAAQEALLRAFRHLGGFDGRASFRTWARRIATNVALDRVDRRRRDRAREGELPAEEVVADPRAEAAPERLAREEERRLVRDAIRELPPAQREAVLLRDVEGLSYAEIGAALGIPKGTVMSRIFYGRANLKERLAGLLGPRAGAIQAARRPEGAP